MSQINKNLRFFTFIFALVFIPFFMGMVCPCASAADDQTVIQTQSCHGCCPEMAAGSHCDAKLETREAVKAPELSSLVFSVQALDRSVALESALDVPSAGPPADDVVSLHEPLFVLNQVFRL